MIITESDLLRRVAERTAQNTEDIAQKNKQRRNQVTDIYGVEYTRQGDKNSPAVFYIPISPASAYLERFSFKLIIQSFASTVAGGTSSATVEVEDTSIAVKTASGSTAANPKYELNPNPHNHSTKAHTHNLVSGVALTPTTASDFKVYIEEIDVTPYLMAQYGSWINGEGVYPSLEIDEDYDILEVASDFMAEGREDDMTKLTRSGYKPVRITSDSPFQVTMVVWVRFSHVNR